MSTTRRSFLAAGAAAPFVWAASKADSKYKILGEGEHRYECIHDWGELPSNIKYGCTHSVCEDSQGHIYVHHTVYATSPSPDSVVVFDSKGKFVRSWGAMFRGGAHGMHLSKEGKTEYIYLCDEKHGIVSKRTLKGEEVWTMGYPQESPIYHRGAWRNREPGGANDGPQPVGLNFRPTNFAIAPNMDFWVGDGYGSSYMFHFSQSSSTAYPKLVRTFGGPPAGSPRANQAQGGAGGRGGNAAGGRGAGKGAAGPPPVGQAGVPRDVPIESMNTPHGNMVDLRDPSNPILLVADRSNNRIVRYKLDDTPIDVIAGTKSPCNFDTYKDTFVVPDLQARVTLFDKNNNIILHLGEPTVPNPPRTTEDRSSFINGQFIAPHGAIFDNAGNIFVVEFVEIGRVTKLRKIV